MIGEFHGTKEEYREEVKKREAEERRSARVNSSGSGRELKSETGKSATEKQKLTFTERKEMGKLEKEIESLEEKKSHLIDSLNDPSLEYPEQDRKSTRLNSSHVATSYAVFCLKKKVYNQ